MTSIINKEGLKELVVALKEANLNDEIQAKLVAALDKTFDFTGLGLIGSLIETIDGLTFDKLLDALEKL
jgi:hypothetical protein